MSAVLHDPLKCGACGGDAVKLTNVRPPDATRLGGTSNGEVHGYIVVTCTGCKRASRIETMPAQLRVTDNSEIEGGALCGGWAPRMDGDS